MLVEQKLYENGHITYMRTDSIIIYKDALTEIRDKIYKLYGEKYYKNNTFKTNKAQRTKNIMLLKLMFIIYLKVVK